MSVQILVGDCREVLKRLPDNHYQCVVTSPPYWGLRDYGIEPVVWGGDPECAHVWGDSVVTDTRGTQLGKAVVVDARESARGQFCQDCGAWLGCLGLEPTPDLYVAHLVDIFRDVRRVLRDDGVLWLNLGDCYAGAPKGSLNGQDKSGLTSTQTQEHAPTSINKLAPGLKPKDLVGIPWMVAFALRSDGWWLRSDVIWHKSNGMPESVRDRPTLAHEHVFLLTKSQRYFYDQDAIREGFADERMGNPGKYNKVSAEERKANNDRQDLGFINNGGGWERGATLGGRNKRDVWTIPTHPFPDSHFATFPPALVEICLKAGTSPHGCCPMCGAAWERVTERTGHTNGREAAHAPNNCPTKTDSTNWAPVTVATNEFRPTCDHDAAPVACRVLDPFGGAGTTGLVADRLGLDATLIEIKDEYAEMARARIVEDAPPMFASVELVT